ncbi:FecR family protein [Echinicola sp. 20G]|uniref:FecR family protein n=1 Tax=Echinicola sp. 20G TaxID=2781961 RepID=UPI001910609D|nr:FecR family protein [Echinicola sp. 20G]
MKSYQKLDDFLEDKSFRDWVLGKNPEANLEWTSWLEENPHLEDLVFKAKSILLELEAVGNEWSQDIHREQYKSIADRIQKGKEKNKSLSSKSYSYRVAAVIILLIAATSIIYLSGGIDSKLGSTSEMGNIVAQNSVTKNTPRGKKQKVNLPDGSIVFLNSASEIKYDNGFGRTNRDISLTGEAFFEVKPNKKLPFNVVSDDLVTTALGTSFNVNAYQNDQIIVKLTTGKVEVLQSSQQKNLVYLEPGEEAIYQLGQKIEKSTFDLDEGVLWRKGVLAFQKDDFKTMVRSLERWYGVDVNVQNLPENEDLRVSGKFEKKPLYNVLESLSYSMGFEYKLEKNQVTINFNPKN